MKRVIFTIFFALSSLCMSAAVTISFVGDQMLFDFGSSSDQYCYPKSQVTWKVLKNKLLFYQGQTVMFIFTANDITSPSGTVREVDNSLQALSNTAGALAESRGKVVNISTANVFGSRTLALAGTDYDIFGGSTVLYDFLTTAETIELVSDSTQDSGGQQGAIAVTIDGLDANYVPQSEVVIMTGIAAATTANTYIRVFSLQLGLVGTLLTNYGEITATSSSSAKVQAVMSKGVGRTQSSFYTIPANNTGYVQAVEVNTWADSTCKANVYFMIHGITNGQFIRLTTFTGSSNDFMHSDVGATSAIPEKFDVFVRANTTRANTVINARYSVFLQQ